MLDLDLQYGTIAFPQKSKPSIRKIYSRTRKPKFQQLFLRTKVVCYRAKRLLNFSEKMPGRDHPVY